ncbi:MAG: hypothetical protein P1V51_22770 [Deltaproteobacteria bacterium]|nr:hypothetical protein [Deltaproteobacteria bacterium]
MKLVVLFVAGMAMGSLPDRAGLRDALFHYPNEAGETAPVGEDLEWEGQGKVQVKFARTYQERRDAALTKVADRLKMLTDLLATASAAEKKADKEAARLNLKGYAADTLGQNDADFVEAVTWEGKRIRMLQRAMKGAKAKKEVIPELQGDRLDNAAVLIDNGVLEERVKQQSEAYRLVAESYAAFLDNKLIDAMKKMEEASKLLPDVGLPHVLMGSFYFLARDQEQALSEWKKALELDPDNDELKQIIEQFANLDE